jgi:hypothetical protein
MTRSKAKDAAIAMLLLHAGQRIFLSDAAHPVVKLLNRHPRADQKLVGYTFVIVHKHHKCYPEVFLDNKDLISWNVCVTGKEAVRDAVYLAARQACYLQNIHFAMNFDSCHWCNSPGPLAADHHPRAFISILNEWKGKRGPVEALRDDEHRPYRFAFAKEEDLQDWRSFHDGIAEFVPSCTSCNSKRGARGPLLRTAAGDAS